MTMENTDQWHEPDPGDLENIRVRRDSPSAGNRDAFLQLKTRLCEELMAALDPAMDLTDNARLRPYAHEHLDVLLSEMKVVLNRTEKRQLLEAIVEELSGSGK